MTSLTPRLGATLVLLGWFGSAAVGQTVEECIQKWQRGSFDEREAASSHLLAGWERWDEAEIDRLRAACTSRDTEVAARARNTLVGIEVRRELGTTLVESGLADLVGTKSPLEVLGALEEGRRSRDAGRLTEGDLEPLADLATRIDWGTGASGLLIRLRGARVRAYDRIVSTLTTHSDPSIRETAVRALGELSATDHQEAAADRLRDPSGEVRAAAADTLAMLEARDQTGAISELLVDRNYFVRHSAVVALSILDPSPEIVDKLAGRLRDPVDSIRFDAAIALGDLGAVRHADLLPRLLNDNDTSVRLAALRALEAIGRPEQAASVARHLQDESVSVARAASRTLARLLGPDDRPRWDSKLASAGPTGRLTRIALGWADRRITLAALEEADDLSAALALLDALGHRHEGEGHRRLLARRKVNRSLRESHDLEAFFAEAGLSLSTDRSIHLDHGRLLSPRETIQFLLPAGQTGYLLEGTTVEFVPWEEALSAWRDRLDG